ncbi:hypothetical protein ACU5EH_20165 [Aliivibrio salmonicida]|uniref:hypothetical protein n=1 Tax=Aliivibrio salmonicida TaxID=40269 RepID=UPI00406CBBF9
MVINKQLQSDLFDSSIVIESQYEMSILTSSDRLPSVFKSDFEDGTLEICRAMGIKWCDEFNSSRHDDVVEFLHDSGVSGCLVKVCTPVPRDFSFKEDGEYWSYNCSWNMYTTHYIYSDSIEECCALAIKWQADNEKEAADRERKEKGISLGGKKE